MYIDFLKTNNQKSQIYELAFWSRLINPFVTFVMLMISAPFVIGIGRGISTGSRIMAGILIGMSFNIFDKITGHVGLVYGIDPMLVAVMPSILMFIGAVVAVRKVSL
jgi:lipopolysaccharide export system permease protein